MRSTLQKERVGLSEFFSCALFVLTVDEFRILFRLRKLESYESISVDHLAAWFIPSRSPSWQPGSSPVDHLAGSPVHPPSITWLAASFVTRGRLSLENCCQSANAPGSTVHPLSIPWLAAHRRPPLTSITGKLLSIFKRAWQPRSSPANQPAAPLVPCQSADSPVHQPSITWLAAAFIPRQSPGSLVRRPLITWQPCMSPVDHLTASFIAL